MDKNTYTVFSLKIANQLISCGFELKGTGINLKKPQYKVFFFENTKELKDKIGELSNT